MARADIARAVWYLSVFPRGTYLVVHLDAADSEVSINRLAFDNSDFSCWLRQQLAEISGIVADRVLNGGLQLISQAAFPNDLQPAESLVETL